MKTIVACWALGVGLVAGSALAQSPSAPAERAIRPQMAKMLQAANAHDTDAFMADMVRSADLVFAIDGRVIHGWDALHAQQLKWWHGGRSDARYAEDGAPGFMSLGPTVEIVTWPLTSSRAVPGGKTRSSRFVVTYVWQRQPQGWRIVYGHESWAQPPG